MKKSLMALGIVLVFLGIIYSVVHFWELSSQNQKNTEQKAISTISIADATLNVEYARTDAERVLGLSGRESMPENQGLLFIFDTPNIYNFWMKDMNFPIDIIWIDENWRVIGITEDIKPETFPETFSPESPAEFVLEVNAGVASKIGIRVGDSVSGASK